MIIVKSIIKSPSRIFKKKIATIVSYLLLPSLFVANESSAQQKEKTERYFQLSITPAFGTSGLHPATYKNWISLNLTSGYSGANYLFEVAGISNVNVEETRGLQIAGLVNITGANAFAKMTIKQREEQLKKGFESNLRGIQFAGLSNIVLSNVFGFQASGILNQANGAFMGIQITGGINFVQKYSFGFQASGLVNISRESINGAQVAVLGNGTTGELIGLQVAAINSAGTMEGKNSQDAASTGIQLGIINLAKKMNGFQIGVINFGKKVQGTQIGLVNIYRPGNSPDATEGTPIGLLNFGDIGYIGTYVNELFLFNCEISTGNYKNPRSLSDRSNKFISNSVIFSKRGIGSGLEDNWAVGYGLKKIFFRKSTNIASPEPTFFSIGIDGLHINSQANKINKKFNLLTRLNIMAGASVTPISRNIYLFGSLTFNAYTGPEDLEVGSGSIKAESSDGGKRYKYWLGYGAGIMIH